MHRIPHPIGTPDPASGPKRYWALIILRYVNAGGSQSNIVIGSANFVRQGGIGLVNGDHLSLVDRFTLVEVWVILPRFS